eukprot:Plantae.Rhodophyta-Hildenbrandia_rubra.ctg1074.p1 GENE.Plantae.Rhodophyta-Hildenbrandia_rubra.ctg1074~~Plantae.Rhodophyta-Hildenbrandia_rubra.ctg1074.p1  ORF type:complete len:412 (-),score=79.84 Plantae.Rhodophyta-Hildenbrandia_rubra.ctg1074:2639-3874(-)
MRESGDCHFRQYLASLGSNPRITSLFDQKFGEGEGTRGRETWRNDSMPGLPLARGESQHRAGSSHFEPSNWVPLLRSITPRTRFIPLPQSFLDYLLSDGVFAYDNASTSLYTIDENNVVHDSAAGNEEDVWEENSVNRDDVFERHREVTDSIEAVISELDGAVSPKIGLRCPVDATWISFSGDTKCETVQEVLTLIKSSDRVAAYVKERVGVIERSGDRGDGQISLGLRQWADMNPSMEFRCFVKNQRVIAVSQRDVTACFEFLLTQKDNIVEKITGRFEDRIRDRLGLETFVMDVYIDRRERVWVIDLGAWGEPTASLLYSWDELDRIAIELSEGDQEEDFEAPDAGIFNSFDGSAWFRCVASDSGIRPRRAMYHGLPLDLQGAAGGAAVAEAAKRLEVATREDEDNDVR